MLRALAEACPDAVSYEHAVLAALDAAVGADVAFFATLAGGPPTTRALDVAALDEAVVTQRYAHELAPLKEIARAGRGVVVDTDVFGLAHVRRCAYHRDFAAPIGGRHTLLAWLVLRGRPLGVVMMGRVGSAFSARDVDTVATALPSITLGRASYHAPIVTEPLRALGEGVARGSLRVRDVGRSREMVAGDFVWTRASRDEPSRSGWFYVDLFHLAAARARRRSSALFVGCGGAVAVRQFAERYPGIALDVVEIDPRVVSLAADAFDLRRIPNVRVHLDCAAAFVARAAPRTWDVIVVDAFGDDCDLPPALATRGFAKDVARALRPGGAVAMNVIGPLRGAGPVRALERTFRAELADVRLVPVLDPGEAFSPAARRNVVLVASAP